MESLTKEHPKWKHHAARFNAVGLEFAYVKFQESVFGEANVLPLILKKWAPDIVIDDHGIPAREWVQPFAGYACPPIFPVSYTLPSAKIYGIGRYADYDTREVQATNLERVAEKVNMILRVQYLPKKMHIGVNATINMAQSGIHKSTQLKKWEI